MAAQTHLTRGDSAPHVVVLTGNPRRQSRTRAAAESFAGALLAAVRADAAPTVVDLADLGVAVIDGGPDVDDALATVRNADVLVVATPVYKASYTGLLKAFLDRFGGGALAGVLAIPFTVAAAPIHRLAGDVHLRPLLVELGASVPTQGFAIEESDLPVVADVTARWLDSNLRVVAALVRVPARE